MINFYHHSIVVMPHSFLNRYQQLLSHCAYAVSQYQNCNVKLYCCSGSYRPTKKCVMNIYIGIYE